MLFGQGAKRLTINRVNNRGCTSAADDDALSKLGTCLCDKAKQDGVSWRLYTQIDRPFVSVISAMENRGVCVDAVLAGNLLVLVCRHCFKLIPLQVDFYLASPKQLAQVLYVKKCNYLCWKKRQLGSRPLQAVLLRLAEEYPLPACIIEHRGLAKLQ